MAVTSSGEVSRRASRCGRPLRRALVGSHQSGPACGPWNGCRWRSRGVDVRVSGSPSRGVCAACADMTTSSSAGELAPAEGDRARSASGAIPEQQPDGIRATAQMRQRPPGVGELEAFGLAPFELGPAHAQALQRAHVQVSHQNVSCGMYRPPGVAQRAVGPLSGGPQPWCGEGRRTFRRCRRRRARGSARSTPWQRRTRHRQQAK